MARSGSISKSAGFGNVTLSWTLVSQTASTKQSKISYELTIYRSSNISSTVNKDYSITINGTVVASGTNTIGGSGTKVLASGTHTLTHNINGECTFSLSFSQEIDITWSGKQIGTLSSSGTGTLDPIMLATVPTLSASTVEIGSPITISLPRDKWSYYHRLRFSWGSQLVNSLIAENVETQFLWIIPEYFMNFIPNGDTGTCYLHVETYDDSGTIGTNTVTFKCTVPADVVPVINSVTLSDTGSPVASSWGVWVQSKSVLHVKTSATAQGGATIRSYMVTYGNTSTYGADIDVATLDSSGSQTIHIYATDSRGRSAHVTRTINVQAYSDPLIEAATIERTNSSGTPVDNGTYAKLTLRASASSVSNNNTATARVYHMRSDLSSWTLTRSMSVAYSYNSSILISGMVSSYTYSYKVEIVDAFTTTTAILTLNAEGAVIGWLAGGIGVSFGKSAEEPYMTDSYWKIHGRSGAQFDNDVDVNGDLDISGTLKYNGVNALRTVDILTAARDGTNMQLGTSSAYVQIDFTNTVYSMRNLLSVSGGGIRIPAGVTAIRVSAQVCLGAATAGVRYVQVSRNNYNTTMARSQKQHASTSTPETHVIPGVITPVTAGDIIIIGVYGNAEDWVYGIYNQTFLTVEAFA